MPWHGTCRRCLEPTGGVSVSEVHELYQRTLTDPDAFEIVGDQLDLRAIARELVLLDTPATPLCRPDCAGLCPTCGANLNDGAVRLHAGAAPIRDGRRSTQLEGRCSTRTIRPSAGSNRGGRAANLS